MDKEDVVIYTMEYYWAIERNEIRSFVETWMDLDSVIQSEISQKEKNKYRILTHKITLKLKIFFWEQRSHSSIRKNLFRLAYLADVFDYTSETHFKSL